MFIVIMEVEKKKRRQEFGFTVEIYLDFLGRFFAFNIIAVNISKLE